jgi:hypothetical protein
MLVVAPPPEFEMPDSQEVTTILDGLLKKMNLFGTKLISFRA